MRHDPDADTPIFATVSVSTFGATPDPEAFPQSLPAADALLQALAYAERVGIACVWINDPGGPLRANDVETITCREFTLEGRGRNVPWLCLLSLMKRPSRRPALKPRMAAGRRLFRRRTPRRRRNALCETRARPNRPRVRSAVPQTRTARHPAGRFVASGYWEPFACFKISEATRWRKSAPSPSAPRSSRRASDLRR